MENENQRIDYQVYLLKYSSSDNLMEEMSKNYFPWIISTFFYISGLVRSWKDIKVCLRHSDLEQSETHKNI